MSNELSVWKASNPEPRSVVESSVELTFSSNFVLSVNALKFFCELFSEFGPVGRLKLGLRVSSCLPSC